MEREGREGGETMGEREIGDKGGGGGAKERHMIRVLTRMRDKYYVVFLQALGAGWRGELTILSSPIKKPDKRDEQVVPLPNNQTQHVIIPSIRSPILFDRVTDDAHIPFIAQPVPDETRAYCRLGQELYVLTAVSGTVCWRKGAGTDINSTINVSI